MASISSTSSSTYVNNASSSNGFSGMISGLDTESLVQEMLSGTQSKIDKQEQEKQRIEWKQEIYRDIITQLNGFQTKFFSFTSDTNLRSESFWNSMSAASSSNAFNVTATSLASTGNMNVEVRQLATNTVLTSGAKVSAKLAGTLNAEALAEYAKENSTLTFKVTLDDLEKEITIDLSEMTDSSGAVDLEKFKGAFEAALGEEHGYGQINLVESEDGAGFELMVSAGRKVSVSGAKETLDILGLKNGQSNRISTSSKLVDLSIGEALQGGTFKFTINGEEFSFTEDDALIDVISAVNSSDAGVRLVYNTQNDTFTMEMTESGEGRRITMTQEEGNLLSALFGAGAGASAIETGKTVRSTALALKEGTVTEDTTLSELGIVLYGSDGQALDGATKLSELSTKTDNLSYEDGRIVVTGEGAGITVGDADTMQILFGTDALDLGVAVGAAAELQEGQNAVVKINGLLTERASNNFSIDGLNFDLRSVTGSYAAASGTLVNAEGEEINIPLKPGYYVEDGVLYDAEGNKIDEVQYKSAEGVIGAANGILVGEDGTLQQFTGTTEKVEVGRDVDQIVDSVKQFIDEYNKIVQTLSGYTTADAAYRDYPPLTDAQRAEMTDKQIELWEEKAKKGLLRGDDNLEAFLQSMRTTMYEMQEKTGIAIYNLGIETGEWESRGQLVLDSDGEAKLRQMIESNPEGVMQFFTDAEDGLAGKLSAIIDQTAKISTGSPGTLVQTAGVEGTGTDTSSTFYNQLKSIEDKIERLKDRYEQEKERYWNQFNAMEQALANLSAQSSYLSSMFMSSY